MSERFEMVLTTQEDFIVKHYFRSYGTGWSIPNLLVVPNKFREEFQKPPQTNRDLLRVIGKF